MGLKEIDWERFHWIHLVLDRIDMWILVKMALNLRVSQIARDL
jgi:hypothetical protein